MRPRNCPNRGDVKWLSASWRRKYRACRIRRPPVVNSCCWRLVRDQLWMAGGRTSRGRRVPRLYCGQPLSVVGVLVPRQAALDGLAKEIRQGELVVASGAKIGEVSLDQDAQAEPLVHLAGQQQPGVGGHRRTPELDAELGVEREVNRASVRVTP
jgi:hypothetical protein